VIRVLHVKFRMSMGGIEKWLVRVLEELPADVRFDFLVEAGERQHFDGAIRNLGGRLLRCHSSKSPLAFTRSVLRVLEEDGPFDVVHSHAYLFSGYVLALAARKGVPVRIAHAHSDLRSSRAAGAWGRRGYEASMRALIHRFATGGVAASVRAAEAVFGDRWREDPRWTVLPCGIDLRPFESTGTGAELRAELGIEPGSPVVCNASRFTPQKNHDLILRIASVLSKERSDVRFLLVGDGPLLEPMRRRATELGIAERVVFPGVRDDVPAILTGVADVFLFPSRIEGLGLAAVEAQAAGVPVVASASIPPEADLAPGYVARLPLSASPEEWAAAVGQAIASGRRDAGQALTTARESVFEITRNTRRLLELYETQLTNRLTTAEVGA